MVNLASIINTKFYIPGETKEVEALRRKAILNGILIYVQAIITLIISKNQQHLTEQLKDCFRKLQSEVLENVEVQDFRLHVYTVFRIMQSRIDHNFEGSSFVLSINDEEKAILVREFAAIATDRIYLNLKQALEAMYQTKGLKVKIPSFLDTLTDFLNSEYLKSTFSRYKKLIENNSAPHIFPQDGRRKNVMRNLAKQGSSVKINYSKNASTMSTAETNLELANQAGFYKQQSQLKDMKQSAYGQLKPAKPINRPSIALIHDIKPLKISSE
jgi:hypothetical protein